MHSAFRSRVFEKVSDTLKVLVICPLLQSQAYRLTDQQTYYETLETIYPQVVKKFPSLKIVLAQQYLWRGKTDQIEALLMNNDSSIALSLMGWLKFQQNNPDAVY